MNDPENPFDFRPADDTDPLAAVRSIVVWIIATLAAYALLVCVVLR